MRHSMRKCGVVAGWYGELRAFVEDYAKLTAAQAASSFGKAVDPAVVTMLEWPHPQRCDER